MCLMVSKAGFGAWLEKKFLEYQTNLGHRVALDEFAQYLQISQSLLSQYLSGDKRPGIRSLSKLEKRLGVEVYDALGLPRPSSSIANADPRAAEVLAEWDYMDEMDKRKITEIVDRAIARRLGEEKLGQPDGESADASSGK